ncbi:UNKNOWN [Stylonychia lemnae]|uniref:Uncharacterized protein n=1 Tax=Stylonychia lemnae TaxID=5949 RepID=A0A078AR15_STYLE|nr:UNKNOWN [Stylonychia lemnae]|eukprot:CDW83692.1 UNKNOWN [Stylonychia lemnae]
MWSKFENGMLANLYVFALLREQEPAVCAQQWEGQSDIVPRLSPPHQRDFEIQGSQFYFQKAKLEEAIRLQKQKEQSQKNTRYSCGNSIGKSNEIIHTPFDNCQIIITATDDRLSEITTQQTCDNSRNISQQVSHLPSSSSNEVTVLHNQPSRTSIKPKVTPQSYGKYKENYKNYISMQHKLGSSGSSSVNLQKRDSDVFETSKRMSYNKNHQYGNTHQLLGDKTNNNKVSGEKVTSSTTMIKCIKSSNQKSQSKFDTISNNPNKIYNDTSKIISSYKIQQSLPSEATIKKNIISRQNSSQYIKQQSVQKSQLNKSNSNQKKPAILVSEIHSESNTLQVFSSVNNTTTAINNNSSAKKSDPKIQKGQTQSAYQSVQPQSNQNHLMNLPPPTHPQHQKQQIQLTQAQIKHNQTLTSIYGAQKSAPKTPVKTQDNAQVQITAPNTNGTTTPQQNNRLTFSASHHQNCAQSFVTLETQQIGNAKISSQNNMSHYKKAVTTKPTDKPNCSRQCNNVQQSNIIGSHSKTNLHQEYQKRTVLLDKEKEHVQKQYQTLKKYERDSKSRKNNRSNYNSTQKDITVQDVEQQKNQKLKQQISGLYNFNLSRCQNLNHAQSNLTTAKKSRKTLQSAMQSDKKGKQLASIPITQDSNLLKEQYSQKDIWDNIVNNHEDMALQSLTLNAANQSGRNLLKQFKTIDTNGIDDIETSPQTTRNQKQNFFLRPPTCFLKKSTIEHSTPDSKFNILDPINEDSRKMYTVKPQSSRKQYQVEDYYYDKDMKNGFIEHNQDTISNRTNALRDSYMSPSKPPNGSSHQNSFQMSTISKNQRKNAQFQARKYQEKSAFLVKKSTKDLTIPSEFNFNTERRAQERSVSKNGRKSRDDLDSAQRRDKYNNRYSNYGGIDEEADQKEQSSLLDRLIREYDLEEVFKQAKSQLDKKNQQNYEDISSTSGQMGFFACFSP